MLFIFASAGSIVETAYQFSQSDDKNGTNAVSCVPLHTPGSDSRTRLASKLPVVLSADEVVRFLEAIPSLKSRTALTTVYAAGLRVSEVVLLKIADNDSQRMVIRVEQGKGGKDRYVMLSPQLLRILRTYWRLARPKRWLFPGRDDERPLVPNVLHAACRLVVGLPRCRAGDRARGRPACRRSRCRRHSRVQSSTTTRMRRSGR
jgi:integrase